MNRLSAPYQYEVTFVDIYVLENLKWYKDHYQKTDKTEPTEEWQFANDFYRFVHAGETNDYAYFVLLMLSLKGGASNVLTKKHKGF